VWNIHTVLNATRVLAPALRRRADARLGDQLPGMSWTEATQAAARIVADLDPEAADRRAETAKSQRAISLRPGRWDGRVVGEPARRTHPGLLARVG
jgi:hypothetical protein